MTHKLQLVLGPESTGLFNCAGEGQRHGLIPWGHAPLTARFFNGDAISPGRLEHAIEWTEDRIQAAHADIPLGSQLYTSEDDLRTLAEVSGVSPSTDMVLHVEAVEATFSRLVMQAFGQAPHQEALPSSARFFCHRGVCPRVDAPPAFSADPCGGQAQLAASGGSVIGAQCASALSTASPIWPVLTRVVPAL